MTNIAENSNDFIEKVSEAEIKMLNTPFGQEIIKQLLENKLKQNPNMTQEEWARTKSEFMAFIFVEFVKTTPEAMKELSYHVWYELRNN